MAEDVELSASVVREYFVKNGGKVKRHDLFDHFRSQLDNTSDEGKLKNQFGDIVNSLAFLQNIEGEKYFVLNKSRNGTTPVQSRRPMRAGNQRKEKGVSLPVSIRNFRFSSTDDSPGGFAENRTRSISNPRTKLMIKSDSLPNAYLLKRDGSESSIPEVGPDNDSGVDTGLSSLQSESPRGSRHGSLPRNNEPDRLSQHSGDTGFFGEDEQYDHDIPSHVLTGFEKSWMMSSMVGNKAEIVCHLDQDPSIVFFKDFIMGYTALHWAAKQGSEDIVRLLLVGGANVNAKSNGGYTALHLASIHGRINIINILIDEYHVDVHVRDHSGKEAKDVLKAKSSDAIKQKLRDPVAVIALQDFEKRIHSGKMKKFGKILARKQHPPASTAMNFVDGANKEKNLESGGLTGSVGSLLDNEDILEHREHVSAMMGDDGDDIMDAESSLQHNMEPKVQQDNSAMLEAWEQDNVEETEDD